MWLIKPILTHPTNISDLKFLPVNQHPPPHVSLRDTCARLLSAVAVRSQAAETVPFFCRSVMQKWHLKMYSTILFRFWPSSHYRIFTVDAKNDAKYVLTLIHCKRAASDTASVQFCKALIRMDKVRSFRKFCVRPARTSTCRDGV